MYPWEEINIYENTTIRIIHEAAIRSHTVSLIYHDNLTIQDTEVYAFVKTISNKSVVSDDIHRFYKDTEFDDEMILVNSLDAVFLRSDPPIDNIMLNFFDSVKNQVFMINDIEGLRKASNKVYPATFGFGKGKYVPKTYVSNNKAYLKKVISEAEDDKLIMKPIDGFGGSGVIILEKSAKKNINSLLEFYMQRDGKNNYVIIQEYAEGAEGGDVRVLMINGEPVGSMRRVPAPDEARSNVHAGGSVVNYILTEHEVKLCKEIGKQLVADGLYFVGLDLIGGKLLEVNVLSPGGIPMINENQGVNIQSLLLDFTEEKIKELK
jgi:glutathione synthase